MLWVLTAALALLSASTMPNASGTEGDGSSQGEQTLVVLEGEIQEADLLKLSDTPGLEILDLSRSSITDHGLAHLTKLRTLREFWLTSCDDITDDGLVHVAQLPGLNALSVAGTPITDAGLAHLHRLNTLTSLDVRGTRVTRAGITSLEKAIPGITIYHLCLNEDEATVYVFVAAAVLAIGAWFTGRRAFPRLKEPRIFATLLVSAVVKLVLLPATLLWMGAVLPNVCLLIASSSLYTALAARWAYRPDRRGVSRAALAAALFVADILFYLLLCAVHFNIAWMGIPLRD